MTDPRRQQERDRARRDIGAAVLRAAAARVPRDTETVTLEQLAAALQIDVDIARDLVEHRRLPRPRRDGGIPLKPLMLLLRGEA